VDVAQFKKIETSGPRAGESYRDDIAFYLSTLETRPNQRYWIECPDGSKVLPPGSTFPPQKPKDGDGVWRWNYDNYLQKKELIVFKSTKSSPLIDADGKQAKWNLYTKSYLKERQEEGNLPRDFWTNFLNRSGTSELKELDIPFLFPKPTSLIAYINKIVQVNNDDIILDFFAGSGTTADAVMQLNKEDGGNRKYILVQLPEPTDEKSEAHKAGFPTIAHITRERVRRVIAKLQGENPLFNPVGDDLRVVPQGVVPQGVVPQGVIPQTNMGKHTGSPVYTHPQSTGTTHRSSPTMGFKAFKLTASNFKLWNPDTAPTDAAELARQLELFIHNIQLGKTDEAILYEIILKAGFPLTAKIESQIIGQQTVYVVENGALLVCLADPIEESTLRGMLALKPVKMVALDVAFHGNDQLKTNIRLQSEQTGEGDQSRTQFVTV
jgi:adenine-specific DNA-methyltransferase